MQPVPFFCAHCTDPHYGFPAMALRWPDAAVELSLKPGRHIIDDSGEICRIKHPGPRRSFVRCVFTIPVPESRQSLEYGVWLLLPEADFTRYRTVCDRAASSEFEGTLANDLPGFPGSLNLPMLLRTRGRFERPVLYPPRDAPDSPLVRAMTEGISDAEGQALLDNWSLAGPDREAA